MTSIKPMTCRYCRTTLPHHFSMADHYAACPVLVTCLEPASPFFNKPQIGDSEKAFRADQRRGTIRARVRLKVEKDKR